MVTSRAYRNVRGQLVIETRTEYPEEGRTLVSHKTLTANEEEALRAYWHRRLA